MKIEKIPLGNWNSSTEINYLDRACGEKINELIAKLEDIDSIIVGIKYDLKNIFSHIQNLKGTP